MQVILSAAAVLTGGCARDLAVDPVSTGVSDAAIPAGDRLRSTFVSVHVRAEGVFESWGKDAPTPLRWRMTRGLPPSLPGESEWSVERIGDPDGRPIERQSLRLLDDGAVALVRQVEHADGVAVDFDPPMIIMPAEMSIGEAGGHVQSFAMVVRFLERPERIKAQGTATNTIDYLGLETLDSPSGPVIARRVRSALRAELSPSRVTSITDQWFVDGVGLVAERRRERTIVMGVAIRDNREAWIRINPAP